MSVKHRTTVLRPAARSVQALINQPDHRAAEEDLVDEVRALEQQVLREAEDPDALKYADAKPVDVFRAVLEVALEDDRLSTDELV
jgi:hypothetical protein